MAAWGVGSSSLSNSSSPAIPNRSVNETRTPHLASTACTSGSRPIRSRSARSLAVRIHTDELLPCVL
jgi:hypothetical protein